MSSSAATGKACSEVMEFPYHEVGEGGGTPGIPWQLQKDQKQREEAARQAGLREGEAKNKALFETQIEELRKEIAVTLKHFSHERHEYFLAVEREAVQLALSITRKILRREANLDPMLLAGMVRVALERISQATRVTVRVHPQQVSEFRMYFARHMQENPPEVVEDPALEPEHCLLQTELGTSDIGPEIQLKEIEQGLLDLQAAKPGSQP